MGQYYDHLTSDNRTVIKTLLQENKSYKYIAEKIGVNRSAMHREIQRNSGLKGYRLKQAHRKAMQRKSTPRLKNLTNLNVGISLARYTMTILQSRSLV